MRRGGAAASLEDLRRHLAEGPFGSVLRPGHSGALRVGVEIEAIAVGADGVPLPPEGREPGVSTAQLLEASSQREGWRATRSPDGAPRYALPGGGVFSFEPGGQVEYSSPPFVSLDALLADVGGALDRLALEAERKGGRLCTRGVDPTTPPASAPLHLSSERYRRMDAHFARNGPAGRVMMRQTAAIHLNLDVPADGLLAWRVANAIAPVLIATFANSPFAGGAQTGCRSWRSEQWRRLDGLRSGVRPPAESPVDDYLDFALGAPALLLGEPTAPTRPFAEWLTRGVTVEDFRLHLTTLFPEVRPRGHLELRSLDTLPARMLAAPVVLATGIFHDGRALAEAGALLPPATLPALALAGREGLSDPALARLARAVVEVALAGARRLGESVVSRSALELAEAFFDRFTARGLDPGSADDAAWHATPGALLTR